MRQLRFVALAEDGTAIVLSDDTGGQYRLAVDERLRAACRGDGVRLGQIEIMMDSSMRPAEIQARVRAGEAPEDIARAGSMSVERVLRFAGPVLQERAQIVQRARATRCKPLADGATPLLGEAVDARLTRTGIDPESATWDAGRRDNGTWRVTVRYSTGRNSGEAVWVYDPVGQQVRPNDDTARNMLVASAPPPLPELARPLSVVPSAAPEQPPTPEQEPEPAPAAKAAEGAGRDEDAARHVRIPSWDDIVFGVRGTKG
ncbi:MAG: septation protein SepH [Actinomycetota bacterium]|nr:septation protein SepH [Actinomycetota bacterium]